MPDTANTRKKYAENTKYTVKASKLAFYDNCANSYELCELCNFVWRKKKLIYFFVRKGAIRAICTEVEFLVLFVGIFVGYNFLVKALGLQKVAGLVWENCGKAAQCAIR